MNMIPVQRPSTGQSEIEAVKEVFGSGWLGLGAKVEEFEIRLSKFLGAKYVVAVNTGTSALHLALHVVGISTGDEVILPSLTFVATAQAVSFTGATPIFCDVLENTLNIDPSDIERKISKRTKAIIPVHYRGVPCAMEKILRLANKYSLRVIEDAAHAFGSCSKGRKIGSFGDISCFSFDPIKNITCGEGGAIVTQDEELYRRLLLGRQLGIDKNAWNRRQKSDYSYDVVERGYRYHLSNINAAIGICQLNKFTRFMRQKIAIARRYDNAFKGIRGLRILNTNYDETALFMYVVRVLRDRQDFMHWLNLNGISTGIHYEPCHQFSLYREHYTYLPVTERVTRQIVTLPLFSGMKQREITRVIESVRSYFV